MSSSTDTSAEATGVTMFNPMNVNLSDTSNPNLQKDIACYFSIGGNEYNGNLGARISALFVILVVSSAATFFPVIAARVRWVKIPVYVYLFARYFGAGVIIATAFIHLLDPAYAEIGPDTCVGMTGGWASYSWPPAIVLVSVMIIFLMDLGAERYVESKFGLAHGHVDVEGLVTGEEERHSAAANALSHQSHQFMHTADQRDNLDVITEQAQERMNQRPAESGQESISSRDTEKVIHDEILEIAEERSFQTQIAAFLILEFGVIFHSVIIGLNLGTAGEEFSTLYPVLVFHQSFEGLGIGARMSAIPFPRRWRMLPWILCTGYGLTTPIAIAIGLGLRNTYNGSSITTNIVSGVLDSISAGILIYTGLVELLARDFLFDPERTKDNKRLIFMCVCVFLGAGLMALLGKWA